MKSIFSFLFALFFILPSANAFVDVESEAVDRLAERGVLLDLDFFFPKKKCTQSQFFLWVVENFSLTLSSHYSEQDRDDLLAGFSVKLGISDSEKGDAPITKLEALTITFRAYGDGEEIKKGEDVFFIDMPKNEEGKNVVFWSLQEHISGEWKRNIFGTNKPLTRLECAEIVSALPFEKEEKREEKEKLKKKTTITIPVILDTKGKNEKPKQEIFDSVWNTIHTKYLHADEVDSEQLMDTVIRRTVESLGDQHTVYFTPQEVEDFLMGVGEKTQFGIGAQVGIDKGGRVQIVKPLRNSPSQKVGLQAGDIIIEVDGKNVETPRLSLEEVVSLIKGEDNTPVVLTLLRRGKQFSVTILRGPIIIQSVFSHTVQGYLVLEVNFFGHSTANDFRELILKNKTSAKKGIILDLRNNPGGLLQSAVDILSHILPKDSVAVKTRGRDILHTEKVRGPGDISYPLVVLVNSRSASASEVVSGAVQDHSRGVVIGEETYGKGTAQEIFRFDDGSALKITIAEWLTPNDRSVHGVGITPDYFFKDTANDDDIYHYAVRIIKRHQWKPEEVQ
jgi:carboxyl-terminal processing protease